MTQVKSILDYIQLALRYIAAGFVSILVIAYLDDKSLFFIEQLLTKNMFGIFGLVGSIGVLIYAIHQAFFDKLWYRFCIWRYKRMYIIPPKLIEEIQDYRRGTELPHNKTADSTVLPEWEKKKYTAVHVEFALFSQTYLRRQSQDIEVVGIQAEIDKKLALLNFLYCAFYSMAFFSTYFLISHCLYDSKKVIFHCARVCCIEAFGIALFSLAISFDYSITRREMWLVQYFYQPICQVL